MKNERLRYTHAHPTKIRAQNFSPCAHLQTHQIRVAPDQLIILAHADPGLNLSVTLCTGMIYAPRLVQSSRVQLH